MLFRKPCIAKFVIPEKKLNIVNGECLKLGSGECYYLWARSGKGFVVDYNFVSVRICQVPLSFHLVDTLRDLAGCSKVNNDLV